LLKLNAGVLLEPEAARQLSPLVLAYIGDTVFDLYVRTSLVLKRRGNAGALHRQSVALVNARAQAQLARRVFENLDADEKDIFMRGRNAKSATVPKNMSVADYRQATALEAVLGYLYLTGRTGKMEDILKEALDADHPIEG
jgi:ribonuclease-3 family protein